MSALVPFLLSMIPGTLFLSLTDVSAKRLLEEHIPERLLIGVTWGAAGSLFALIVWWFGVPEVSPSFLPAAIATSFLNIFGQFAWYRASRDEHVSFTAPLRLLIPLLVVGTGWLFLNETPTILGILGILLTVGGLWFLVSSEVAFRTSSLKTLMRERAVRFALLGVLSFALSFPFDKQAVVASSTLFSGSVVFPIIAVGNLVLFLLCSEWKQTTLRTLWRKRRLLAWHLCAFTLGSFLALYALNFALAAYASSIKRLQALWSVIFSGAFLGEGNIVRKVMATLIMLLGIIFTVVFG